MRGPADYAKFGDYNVICDRCGFKFKATQCQMEWDNLFVCNICYEERHPQDFVRGIPDDQRVPIARPSGPYKFREEEITPDDL